MLRILINGSGFGTCGKGNGKMKNKVKNFSCGSGFTLIEVLTAIMIIAILVGLLVPATNMVRKTANTLRQKAQFHSIEFGLEAYKTDFGNYPDSMDRRILGGPLEDPYGGAQKLAEALVGWDGFGFHPKSVFRSDGLRDWDGSGTFDPGEDVYHITADTAYETAQENLSSRIGPYLEIEKARAVQLKYIYNNTGSLDGDRYVLADSFGKVTHLGTRKSTGMPIFYFKANTLSVWHDKYEDDSDVPYIDRIFNFNDNLFLLDRRLPWDQAVTHPMLDPALNPDDGYIFYRETANPDYASPVRPYRAESFLLLSAGPDGEYGTPDDIYNFEAEE